MSLLIRFDFILLTETWANDTEYVDIPGFNYFSSNRVRNPRARRDSGGIAFYYAKEHSKGVSVHEDLMWVKLSKEYFNLEKDLCIALFYAIPPRSTRRNYIEVDYFQLLVNDIAEFKQRGYEVLVTGDLNARTSVNPDFVENDDDNMFVPLPDDYVPDYDVSNDFPHKRASEDVGDVNENVYRLLDACKETGLRIVNGRSGVDTGVGKYTCHIQQGSSLVDYLLSDASFFSNILEI